ncbi:hypothetical protein J6590_034239 [Homalodisca vitripennis]|nr:hypothetical protein J6590_034239 [Homalodisca vitripennis]
MGETGRKCERELFYPARKLPTQFLLLDGIASYFGFGSPNLRICSGFVSRSTPPNSPAGRGYGRETSLLIHKVSRTNPYQLRWYLLIHKIPRTEPYQLRWQLLIHKIPRTEPYKLRWQLLIHKIPRTEPHQLRWQLLTHKIPRTEPYQLRWYLLIHKILRTEPYQLRWQPFTHKISRTEPYKLLWQLLIHKIPRTEPYQLRWQLLYGKFGLLLSTAQGACGGVKVKALTPEPRRSRGPRGSARSARAVCDTGSSDFHRISRTLS